MVYNSLADKQVMGIININAESFYRPSRYLSADDVENTFLKMLLYGADIIDIGACSTRPGSIPVSQEQEWEYLQKPLERIAEIISSGKLQEQNLTTPVISIDTFRHSIVYKAHKILGKFIVNDISASENDSQMLTTVSDLGLGYIAMHKRGNPDTMQQHTEYPNGVVAEVKRYFEEFAEKAEKAGISDWILDPGFGFAKTVEQNYQLLTNLNLLSSIGKKILVGISRKSMIYKPLSITPEDSLPATCALNLFALTRGAHILRVHDVREGVQAITLYAKISEAKENGK